MDDLGLRTQVFSRTSGGRKEEPPQVLRLCVLEKGVEYEEYYAAPPLAMREHLSTPSSRVDDVTWGEFSDKLYRCGDHNQDAPRF